MPNNTPMTPDQFFADNALKLVNGNTQLSNYFHVEFMNIPENINQVLDLSVKSVTQPRLSYSAPAHRAKGHTVYDKGDFVASELTVTFTSDEGGVVRDILLIQSLRQLNKITDINGQSVTRPEERDYWFGIRVHTAGADNKIKTTMDYRECFIRDIDFGTYDNETTQPSNITVVFAVNIVGVEFSDDVMDLIEFTQTNNRIFKLT